MTSALELLAQHPISVSTIGIVLILIGVLLFRGRGGIRLSAKSGGVVVAGDNRGSIKTEAGGSSTADKVIAIFGLLVTVIGVVVALLAWWYPKAPP